MKIIYDYAINMLRIESRPLLENTLGILFLCRFRRKFKRCGDDTGFGRYESSYQDNESIRKLC